jgi:DnaK suppressor protein
MKLIYIIKQGITVAQITEHKINEMKDLLVAEFQSSQTRLRELQKSLTETRENDPDPSDVASKVEERNNVMAESRRISNRVKHISKALRLIDLDDYGCCQDCGCDIPIRRLDFDPASIFCVECKTQSEADGRQFAPAI